MVILVLISLFLASPWSLFLWQHLPLPQLVQFPWRFLAITAFAVAVLAKKHFWLLFLIILAIPFLKITPTFHPESYYLTNDDSTTVKNEYMPKGVKIDPTNRPVSPATVYFPGIKVIVNGQEIVPEVDNNGIVKTSGKVVFRETPVRLFADFLTVLGLFVCAIFLIRDKRIHILFVSSAVYGLILEEIGKYFGPVFDLTYFFHLPGPEIFAIPLIVILGWATIITVIFTLNNKYFGHKSILYRAFLDACLAAALDFIIEPFALKLNLWTYFPSGPYFGIPLINFVGWFVIVFIFGLVMRLSFKDMTL